MSGVMEEVAVFNTAKKSWLGEHIQVADRGLDRLVGLLGRPSLVPGTGLLIIPTQAIHTVGMSFPIDVVFIDKHYRVVGVRKNIRPYRMTRIFWRALGVLELPIGMIDSTRTEVGDQLRVGEPLPLETS